jgi:hypothetical protein
VTKEETDRKEQAWAREERSAATEGARTGTAVARAVARAVAAKTG